MPDDAPYTRAGAQVLFGEETTQGTSVTVDTRYRLEDSVDLPDPENEWIVQRVVGDGRTPESKELGQQQFQGGSLPITLTDGDTKPLLWLLGDSTSTNGTQYNVLAGSDPSNVAVPPSFTLQAGYYGAGTATDIAHEFNGCVVDSGSIEVGNDNQLVVNLDSVWALGVDEDATITSDPGLVTGDKWLFSDVSSNLTLAGQTVARLQDFTLEISNNANEERYIEDTAAPGPFGIYWGNNEITANLTIVPTDNTLYNELAEGNQFAGSIEFTNANGGVLNISFSSAGVVSAPHSIPDEGAVEVDAELQPDDVTIEVTNP